MLSNLYIENIAVIEKTEIDFSRGFNVLTGETGAGKSIVIDSINAVLGKRSSKGLVRTGADSAFVSATFDNISKSALSKLESMGYSGDEGPLILTRELSATGRNVCRIGSRPCSVSTLREIGEYLVNIHGQNDNLELMNPSLHIIYIDALADMEDKLSSYRELYKAFKEAEKELCEAQTDESERLARADLLTFQINELEDADLRIGEYDELNAEKTALRNREKIISELMKAKIALDGDDDIEGALRLVDDASAALIHTSQYLTSLEPLSDRLSSALYELQEISSSVRDAIEESDADPSRLDEIEQRLELIYRLKKKYGSTEEEMLSYLEKAREELLYLNDYSNQREQLERRYRDLFKRATAAAEELSEIRKQTALRFKNDVEREMAFLDMPYVRMEVSFEKTELNPRGFDKAEFLISANPGEAPGPVNKIASGGELSRMMLAIKTALSKSDFAETMIFDEIDTGISGSAADKVGKKLSALSAECQVICVTHQAQIAAYADNHLLITKTVDDSRTYTKVTKLDHNGRVEELGRIVGGEEITDSARAHAEQLLAQDHKAD